MLEQHVTKNLHYNQDRLRTSLIPGIIDRHHMHQVQHTTGGRDYLPDVCHFSKMPL